MNTKILSLISVFSVGMASVAGAQNVLEDFEDGNAASRFTVVRSTDPDSDAEFFFDYNVPGWDTNLIGAPNGWQTTTRGMRLWANDNAPGVIAGINAYYNGLNRTGSTTLRFDMYYRFLEETVSTEYCLWGMNHSTQTGTFNSINTVALPSQNATSGYWCSASADGGTTRDYRMMKVSSESTVAANYLGGSQNNNTAGWGTLFPDLDGAATLNDPGHHGNRWVQVELSYNATSGERIWKMKQRDDATWTTCFADIDVSPFEEMGTFQFGLTDPFASQSMPESFLIIDNVEVVDTSSMVLARSVSIVQGTPFGGNLNSLHNVDGNQYFVLNDESDPNTEVRFSSVSPITAVASVGANAVASSTRNDQTVFLAMRNMVTNSFVNIASGSSTFTNSTYSGVNTSNPADFVNATTRQVEARLLFIPQADLEAADGWSEAIDSFHWNIN